MKSLSDVSVKEYIEQETMDKWLLERYVVIMDDVWRVDVSSNIEFQKKFKYFYRIRLADEWCEVYFRLFEEMKKDKLPSFEKIITAMLNRTKGMVISGNLCKDGRVEASFSSKMLATIRPDKPIWDSHVLKQLSISVPTGSATSRVQQCIKIYEQLENEYNRFIKTEKAKNIVHKFDKLQSGYTNISAVKKIDYLVWSLE